MLERVGQADHPAHGQAEKGGFDPAEAPAGASLPPWPRVSKRSTLYRLFSTAACSFHMAVAQASEWLITTHGPSPSISYLTCIRFALTFIVPSRKRLPGRGWKYSADGRHLTRPGLGTILRL